MTAKNIGFNNSSVLRISWFTGPEKKSGRSVLKRASGTAPKSQASWPILRLSFKMLISHY